MDGEEPWVKVTVLSGLVVWGALGWILMDPDLQGVRDRLGWWMLAIGAVPLVITVLGTFFFATAEGGGGDWEKDGHGAGTGAGCGGACGGCGG
ncbi:hypothetical protein AB4039_36690 [Streptomyces sp. M-16]|uniref:hypothetical protein n=1 Tax=Streptomyces sp. M-16 TaxID=3233040 RepID=UPI00225AB12F